MAGQMIDTGTTQAYVAKPASGSGPGVVVVQEFWGLVPHIKDICDRLANEGYVAVAPDLYHGKVGTNFGEARQLMEGLNADQAGKDLTSAISALKSQGATGTKVGTIGFCMGGKLALVAATLSSNVGACADFYGGGPAQPDYSKLQGPVLMLVGDQDKIASPDDLGKQRDAIKAAGKQAELVVYPGCDHGFNNDTRPEVYKADAAKDAWGKAIALFKANL
ncbi:MAG TPA: dienelactone hydrolase family protein [Chloroflexota bacterium]